jgi:hypothetical protein
MTNLDNRVLNRKGARELTATETEDVSAAFSGTNACSLVHFNLKTTTVTGADCDTHDSDTGNDVS